MTVSVLWLFITVPWAGLLYEIVAFPDHIHLLLASNHSDLEQSHIVLVQEPLIGLIKWLRPKGLKVCSYVEKCAEFKNQTLKKMAGTQKCYAQLNTPGVCNISK